MAKLPQLPYRDKIRKAQQIAFGGYNHTAGAKDGQIWDMLNMTSDEYPVLSTRKRAWEARKADRPYGLHVNDGLYWVDGTDFMKDGERKGKVSEGAKVFADLGSYIIVFPDKKYYNKAEDKFGEMEHRVSGSFKIKDGTYAGETAKANTIYSEAVKWTKGFRVGDGVTISGATRHSSNNKTVVIKEKTDNALVFYENSFDISSGGDNETLTIARSIPDMDFICENENRLWGCKGDTIYASKLGDPFNFNVFDGVATDSYAVKVGSAGEFTACAKFLGHAVFFKEEMIYKVYGNKPSNFQVMGSGVLGVKAGSHNSIAIASERMFYLSRAGIVVYTGGVPQSISEVFGKQVFKSGVGGSDGKKYYISLESDTKWQTFVYDPAKNMWHKLNDLETTGFAYYKGLFSHIRHVGFRFDGLEEDKPEGYYIERDDSSMVEFADFVEDSPNKKGTSKLQLRTELAENASISVYIQFDSSGKWELVKKLNAPKKRSFYLPIIPRRSDHFRIKIEGIGQWKLHSLVRESYIGSEL